MKFKKLTLSLVAAMALSTAAPAQAGLWQWLVPSLRRVKDVGNKSIKHIDDHIPLKKIGMVIGVGGVLLYGYLLVAHFIRFRNFQPSSNNQLNEARSLLTREDQHNKEVENLKALIEELKGERNALRLDEEGQGDKCSICLYSCLVPLSIRCCKKMFCNVCLFECLQDNNKCPLCRSENPGYKKVSEGETAATEQ